QCGEEVRHARKPGGKHAEENELRVNGDTPIGSGDCLAGVVLPLPPGQAVRSGKAKGEYRDRDFGCKNNWLSDLRTDPGFLGPQSGDKSPQSKGLDSRKPARQGVLVGCVARRLRGGSASWASGFWFTLPCRRGYHTPEVSNRCCGGLSCE